MFVWCLENPQRALGCGQQVAAILAQLESGGECDKN